MKTLIFALSITMLFSPFSVSASNDSETPVQIETTQAESTHDKMMEGKEMGMDSEKMKAMMKEMMKGDDMDMDSEEVKTMMADMMKMMKTPMHKKIMKSPMHKTMMKEMMGGDMMEGMNKGGMEGHHSQSNAWTMVWHSLMGLLFLALATFIVRKTWDAAGKK